MKEISGAEIKSMRRMIGSDRTSQTSRASYEKILQKYNVPLTEPKKNVSDDKRKILEQIAKMENVLKFSEDKEKIAKIINSLKTALKFV